MSTACRQVHIDRMTVSCEMMVLAQSKDTSRKKVRVGSDDQLHSCSRAMICRSRSPLSSPFSHPKSSSTSMSMLSLLFLQCLCLEHGHGGDNDSTGIPRIPSRPSARVKLQQACFVIDVTRNISFRMPLLVELISIPLRKNQLFLSVSLSSSSHTIDHNQHQRDQTRPLSADGGACYVSSPTYCWAAARRLSAENVLLVHSGLKIHSG